MRPLLSNSAVNIFVAIKADATVEELEKKLTTIEELLEAIYPEAVYQGLKCSWTELLAVEIMSVQAVSSSQWWPDATKSKWQLWP